MIPSGARVIRENFDKADPAFAWHGFFAATDRAATRSHTFASVVLVNWLSVCSYTTGALGLFWIVGACSLSLRPAREDAPPPRRKPTRQIRWSSLLQYPTPGRHARQAGYPLHLLCLRNLAAGYLVLHVEFAADDGCGRHGCVPHRNHLRHLGGWAGERLIRAGHPVTLVRQGFASGAVGATLFNIAGAYSLTMSWRSRFSRLSVASVSFRRGGELHAIDWAPLHMLSSLVSLQTFSGRQCRRIFCADRHGRVDFDSGDFTLSALFVAAGVALSWLWLYGLIVGNLGFRAWQGPASSGTQSHDRVIFEVWTKPIGNRIILPCAGRRCARARSHRRFLIDRRFSSLSEEGNSCRSPSGATKNRCAGCARISIIASPACRARIPYFARLPPCASSGIARYA